MTDLSRSPSYLIMDVEMKRWVSDPPATGSRDPGTVGVWVLVVLAVFAVALAFWMPV